jgi:hypothetical protein
VRTPGPKPLCLSVGVQHWSLANIKLRPRQNHERWGLANRTHHVLPEWQQRLGKSPHWVPVSTISQWRVDAPEQRPKKLRRSGWRVRVTMRSKPPVSARVTSRHGRNRIMLQNTQRHALHAFRPAAPSPRRNPTRLPRVVQPSETPAKRSKRKEDLCLTSRRPSQAFIRSLSMP